MTNLSRRCTITDVNGARQAIGIIRCEENNGDFPMKVTTTTTNKERQVCLWSREFVARTRGIFHTTSLGSCILPLQRWDPIYSWRQLLAAERVIFKVMLLFTAWAVMTERLCRMTLKELYSCVLGYSIIQLTHSKHLNLWNRIPLTVLSFGLYNSSAEVIAPLFHGHLCLLTRCFLFVKMAVLTGFPF